MEWSQSHQADDIAYVPLSDFCQEEGVSVCLTGRPTTLNPR